MHDSKLSADMAEDVEGELQFVACVCRGHNRADAGLVARDRRVADTLREHAFLEQTVRQLHRQRGFADDNRRDWALARSRVEPEGLQARLEEPCVFPEAIDDLRFFHQDVERRDARSGDARWMRRGEQERSRAVIEKLYERSAACDVAAERADGFRERPDLDVYAAVQPEMVDRAAAVPAEHAARVR